VTLSANKLNENINAVKTVIINFKYKDQFEIQINNTKKEKSTLNQIILVLKKEKLR
jgi:hypothetical protein